MAYKIEFLKRAPGRGHETLAMQPGSGDRARSGAVPTPTHPKRRDICEGDLRTHQDRVVFAFTEEHCNPRERRRIALGLAPRGIHSDVAGSVSVIR